MSRSIPASDVFRVGEDSLRAATAKAVPMPPPERMDCGGFGVIHLKLGIDPAPSPAGVIRLVNTETGQCVGLFASPAVATRTQDFFNRTS